MVDIYANIGAPTIASRGFVPLAVEAGIANTIKSLISGLALDARSLLLEIKSVLSADNEPLAAALNMDNLAAIIAYMELSGTGIMAASGLPVTRLPVLLDEDGPAVVSAGRDGGEPTQVNIGYSAPPDGYTAEIYLDGVFAKRSDLAPTGETVFDIVPGVPVDGLPHTIRVLFSTVDGETGEEQQTRFGPVAAFT